MLAEALSLQGGDEDVEIAISIAGERLVRVRLHGAGVGEGAVARFSSLRSK